LTRFDGTTAARAHPSVARLTRALRVQALHTHSPRVTHKWVDVGAGDANGSSDCKALPALLDALTAHPNERTMVRRHVSAHAPTS